MYIMQKHLETLQKVLTPGKAVIIYGARRTGKTTLLTQFIKDFAEPYLLVSGEDITVQGLSIGIEN